MELRTLRLKLDSAAKINFGYPHRSESKQVEAVVDAVGKVLVQAGIHDLSVEAVRGLAVDAIQRTEAN